ncbi:MULTISPECIES: MFS transporter [Fusobacterium]|uniref:MFS transporter n=1 Tax=Fusobacterium TaxID=848 RepID=UPI0008A2605D|nr:MULTISPECIES: MFS transporter [Fusobacterium]OFL81921.1 melibiose carrier protein [Fusobacterium sp. HMSC073F01]RGJ30899.1 MFS transporter [Fusobacterium varium]
MGKRIPLSIQIFYGLGVSYAIVDQIFAQWILYFYLPPENSGLKPVMAPLFISLALVISRLVDMITDPVVGFLSDRVNTKWGRRIPFIAVGTIPLAICTTAFFYPPMGNEKAAFIYLAIIGSLFFSFYTVVGAPYNALIPEIGQTQEERLNLSTWQSIFRLLYTAVAMIIPGVLIKIIGKGDVLFGVRGMVISLCAIAVIGGYITVFLVPERKYSLGQSSDASFKATMGILFKNKSFVLYLLGLLFFFIGFNNLRAVMNYFVEDIMGYGKGAITLASALLFGMSALCFYPTNLLSRKYGYRKIMLSCLVMLIIFTAALFFLGKAIPAKFGFILFALIGIPIAGAGFIFPPAMLSEIGSRISDETGHRIEGVCFGIQGFFLKMAFLISILILPIILVSGNGDILSAITGTPKGVEKSGIYLTSIVSTISFIISFIFYYKYEE